MQISTVQAKTMLTKTGLGFTQLGLNMLIGRLSRQYAQDSSGDALNKYTGEINNFVSKYEAILGKDMALIKSL